MPVQNAFIEQNSLTHAQVIPMFMNRFLTVLGESSTPLSTGSFGGATTRS